MSVTDTATETTADTEAAGTGTPETASRPGPYLVGGRALTPEEWREYFRRYYAKCLNQTRVRLSAGWVESEAETWLLTAEAMLTKSSIQTRKVTKNADI